MTDEWEGFLDAQPIGREFRTLVERRIPFARWGFSLIGAGRIPSAEVLLVYESSRCRVRVGFRRGMYALPTETLGEGIEDHVFYSYGRRHAPTLGEDVTSGGRAFVAWHAPFELLCYLDYAKGDISEEDLANVGIVPPTWRVCLDKVAKQDYPGRIDAWAAAIAASWEFVGDELFSLLDLNRPDLWGAYVAFRKMQWELIKRRKRERLGDRAQASVDLLAPSYEQEVA